MNVKIMELKRTILDKNAEILRLKGELEQTRVQLAGCGVAALCNTRESMVKQIVGHDAYGYSASYQDVLDAVGREIKLREMNESIELQLAEARKETDRLRKICDPETEIEACEMIASVKEEARQDAAREILTDLQKCFFAVDFETVRDNIKHKFKLEAE